MIFPRFKAKLDLSFALDIDRNFEEERNKMTKTKITITLLGDLAIFYGSLALSLLVRYGWDDFNSAFSQHFYPFSLILAVWAVIFYLFDLCQMKTLKDRQFLARYFFSAITACTLISIFLFYILSDVLKISPKTNLFLFVSVFALADYNWRLFLIRRFKGWQANLLFLGDSPAISESASFLKTNQQLGYKSKIWKKEIGAEGFGYFLDFLKDNKIEKIVVSSASDKKLVNIAYKLLPLGIESVFLRDFYEEIFKKISFEEVDEAWFVKEIKASHKFYDACKRAADLVLAPILLIVFSPIILASALLVKASSSGPAIYKQERIGKGGKPFVLYKLRTMASVQGGKDWALWTKENDDRVTRVGKILRHSHLDELPQLFNIAKGDISFVGPRAERTELAEMYGRMPYYDIRHIVKPGLTGWAQISYKPSASLSEGGEKLKYDIYYIKNRSLILDLSIIIRTIRMFFVSPK